MINQISCIKSRVILTEKILTNINIDESPEFIATFQSTDSTEFKAHTIHFIISFLEGGSTLFEK